MLLGAEGCCLLNATEGPSCTDVLPARRVFAWSSHPFRTAGPDEELEKLHLAASDSRWAFCPQTANPPFPLSLILTVLLKTRETARKRNPSWCLAQGVTFNVGAQMEKRARHGKSAVM